MEKIGKSRINESLHQFIGTKMGIIGDIDHRNGNGLDNREENLRSVTESQNAMNTKLERNNKTGRKGIYDYPNRRKRYRVRITIDYQIYDIGYFETLEEAKAARQQAEIHHFGQFRREE